MIPLSSIQSQVSHKIQKGDATYLTKINEFIQQRYDDILRRYPWPQMRRETTFVCVAGTTTVILPKDVDHIISIEDRVNGRALFPLEPSNVSRTQVQSITQQDIPYGYFLEETTVQAQPTSASVLALVSNNGADTSEKVRIWGLAGGQLVTELVALNGTNSVNSVNSYTRVDSMTKDSLTSGTVTITSNGGAVTVGTLAPREYTLRCRTIRLVWTPSSSITYNMVYKLKPSRLEFNEDIPIIPCQNALISGAYADCLKEQRQFQKNTIEEERYEALVASLIFEQEQQSEKVTLFVPHIERDRLDRPVY